LNAEFKIRRIIEDDNEKLASIIRASLEEFGAAKHGTVYYDASTDRLHEVFQKKKSAYFVAEANGEIVGGGGIFPTEGLPPNTCELVKMYVSSPERGMGLGKLLLNRCIEEAKNAFYQKMYIETMPELTTAIEMYKKNGFTFIPGSLGNSGHSGCDVFMIR
jgi:putative acetyltransferase